ncbi:PREDICTED: zinc metalloproteinase-disintegrin-like crotastatin [Nanorana parkeri]|uniref:zinc metalloproteinase-disintegrin-like crotastatin n=1 Tax=Nanorana parkeri TaxID=125878 RepID=UPI000854F32A|nr:PREDICTED: zinc metalloproteinase-disintegrin-like crotastatin [Nanorana parkeri]
MSPLVMLILQVLVADLHALPSGQTYETVVPRRIHAEYKRDAQDKYPHVATYELHIEGKPLVLHLERNEDLIADNYKETSYHQDDTPIMSSPNKKIKDHCHYQGYVENDSQSVASISTCSGISGVIMTQGRRLLIEPQDLTSEEHVVYEEKEPPKTCGTLSEPWEEFLLAQEVLPALDNKEEIDKLQNSWKYIEMYMVADKSLFDKFKQNATAVKNRIYEVTNYMNMVFKAINVSVVLVGLEIWETKNQMEVNSSMGKSLNNFSKWRKEMLLPRLAHDNAYLFSAIDFDGVTVGLAHIGVMCNEQYSAGVVQHASLTHAALYSAVVLCDEGSRIPALPTHWLLRRLDHTSRCTQNKDFTKSSAAVGATFVHEISHNLGVNHDNANCSCSSLTCIMSPYVGSPIPYTFSKCSLDQFKTFLMTKVPTCLLNEPNKKTSMAPPVCGNHFVEMGEQCDCGTEQECTNPCCDALTCNLKAGAVCADGECCEKCQMKKEGSVCRLSLHDCDLPDKCDGKSNLCLDLFKKDGASCMNGQGYCLHGKCPTLANQCTALWGSGALVAADTCFNVNMRGANYGYCTQLGGKFQPCLPQSATGECAQAKTLHMIHLTVLVNAQAMCFSTRGHAERRARAGGGEGCPPAPIWFPSGRLPTASGQEVVKDHHHRNPHQLV